MPVRTPSAPSGRIAKAPKGAKSADRPLKTHRWESFTKKIAKLHTLDPLKKVRRHDLDDEDLSTTTSYFQNGLMRWNELCMAKTFISFKLKCFPLVDSLPQIIHYEDRIMNLFVDHVEQAEKESLEPLLDLVTAFARDLGPRFEKHYPRALQLIVDVASKPQDALAIEWTFTALAFLFKRLYKLLVPDLRPTYDVVSCLLGKAKRPPHIARFAAEAMSFLIMKAAAPNHRSTALPLIIEHTRKDLYALHGTRQYTLFQDALMTMYAEAIKGVGTTVHSTGPSIITALFDSVPPQDFTFTEPPLWTDISCGVVTSIIHHSNRTDISPISEAIYDMARIAKENRPKDTAYSGAHIVRALGLLAGVRKGSRVAEWESLIGSFMGIFSTAGDWPVPASDEVKEQFWRHIIMSTALIWTYAPVHTLTPSLLSFTNTLSRDPFRDWYIPFCAYFSSLDPTRFRNLFLNSFQGLVYPL
ncbi:hypothetical protein IMZ48_31310 [Candidatus Bathyarchaeota archaeon]|nr:hypothetical protein [Candidatus Bathyarchaeota archaeon]